MPEGRRVAEEFVDRLIRHAMDGRSAYMKEIMDRNDGPIPRPEPASPEHIDDILDEADRVAAERDGGRPPGGSPGPVPR